MASASIISAEASAPSLIVKFGLELVGLSNSSCLNFSDSVSPWPNAAVASSPHSFVSHLNAYSAPTNHCLPLFDEPGGNWFGLYSANQTTIVFSTCPDPTCSTNCTVQDVVWINNDHTFCDYRATGDDGWISGIADVLGTSTFIQATCAGNSTQSPSSLSSLLGPLSHAYTAEDVPIYPACTLLSPRIRGIGIGDGVGVGVGSQSIYALSTRATLSSDNGSFSWIYSFGCFDAECSECHLAAQFLLQPDGFGSGQAQDECGPDAFYRPVDVTGRSWDLQKVLSDRFPNGTCVVDSACETTSSNINPTPTVISASWSSMLPEPSLALASSTVALSITPTALSVTGTESSHYIPASSEAEMFVSSSRQTLDQLSLSHPTDAAVGISIPTDNLQASPSPSEGLVSTGPSSAPQESPSTPLLAETARTNSSLFVDLDAHESDPSSVPAPGPSALPIVGLGSSIVVVGGLCCIAAIYSVHRYRQVRSSSTRQPHQDSFKPGSPPAQVSRQSSQRTSQRPPAKTGDPRFSISTLFSRGSSDGHASSQNSTEGSEMQVVGSSVVNDDAHNSNLDLALDPELGLEWALENTNGMGQRRGLRDRAMSMFSAYRRTNSVDLGEDWDDTDLIPAGKGVPQHPTLAIEKRAQQDDRASIRSFKTVDLAD
ncbi:uncharacterized protein BJ171DRAFT_190564 [Polychytrium aggregatum]|uniref:uncharacterized protein n=1 Tax=Polychytrium aggregatum TaxID=110093 RepID=UPI0022FF2B17|nr:uncharacterized protein BJ171DRAFT_190564 [Polychytrium aggregatum]KAI9202067.1 hypothetical protein BJ171DRAFT_190564 [Polychytrium aggregatum]